jgi:Arc/MetJ family transcription regulator
MVFMYHGRGIDMAMTKKTIELDQEAVTRIKTALNAKSEKEAINYVLRQFDTDLQIAESTLSLAGNLSINKVYED